MEQTKPFFDFCVPFNKDDKQMRAILNELVELGYKTIAIDQSFDHSKKDAGKRGSEMFPAPHSIEHLRKEFADKLRILQRITILYVDVNLSHAMSVSYNLRKFNLIAGQPKTDAALTHCCTTFTGDIITFDPVAGSRLSVNRKAYQVAVRRGMFFEIKYAPAIADSNNRKDMIKMAQNYSIKGKSKNIILSSGAEHEFQLRGPYDVANLAFIFGLSEDQGKNAVDRFCRQIFLRAESRRLGKTIMFVKGNGPIVFSDDDQSGAEDDEMDGLGTEMSKDVQNEEQTEIKPPIKRLKVA
ncbi:ribonuclease P protein subunit p30 [Drosophila pseudoobscura]|uniref:Ribonuclease P protein subunit p30 n=1 Tax=Drosophila pseudoobscura pseudoobscura TaxID=46245 RepID=A0A6I8ULT9_DROPS|nr:ribonuclease P protein subunit p30 [Drosophila pseudoobscura]